MSFFISDAMAAAPQGQADPLTSFLPLIIIFVVFYFLLIRPQSKKAKEHKQMVEALAKDGVKTLEDFATCADWELAGGWTTVDGERVKDDGVLEKFDVSLGEAQDMVMTARIQLGWVDPAELETQEAGDEADAEEDAV